MTRHEQKPSRSQIARLLRDIRTVPVAPVGEHLSNDDLFAYAREEMSLEDLNGVQEHLRSCLTCVVEAERMILMQCDAFLSHLPQFCERSMPQREMSELSRHAESCPSCRQAYWNVRPTWKQDTMADLKRATKAIKKVLAEKLDLILDSAGRLYQQGLGLPAIERKPLLLTIGEQEPESGGVDESRQKKWRLADEEARCVIRLEVRGLESGDATAKCWIEAESPATIDIDGTIIEVLDAGSNSLELSGRLSDYQSEPIVLSEGSWIIRLQSTGARGVHTWDISLDVHRAQADKGELQ